MPREREFLGKRNVEDRLLLEFCFEKNMCVGNSWFKKKDNRKVIFNVGCSGTEIDFVLMKGSRRKFLKNVGAIERELQHKLLKMVLDGRWIRKIQHSHAKKVSYPKVWKFLNDEVKTKFSEKMEVFYQKNERNA